MNTEVRIDTDRLRDHLDLLREEHTCAQELRKRLTTARMLSGCGELTPLIQKAEYLALSRERMRRALEETCEAFENLGVKVSGILNDYIALNKPESK